MNRQYVEIYLKYLYKLKNLCSFTISIHSNASCWGKDEKFPPTLSFTSIVSRTKSSLVILHVNKGENLHVSIYSLLITGQMLFYCSIYRWTLQRPLVLIRPQSKIGHFVAKEWTQIKTRVLKCHVREYLKGTTNRTKKMRKKNNENRKNRRTIW